MKAIIYFLKSGQGRKNTASHNRFLMLKQMCEKHFETQVAGFQTFENRIISKYKLLNAVSYRLNILRGAISVPASSVQQKNILFLLSTDPFLFLLVWIIARFKGNRIINERNEFPETIRKGIKWRVFIYKATVLWWQYRLIDGVFLMTDELVRFYTPHTRRSCVIQKMPMTVDFGRFDLNTSNTEEVPYIFYAGSFSQKKDGVKSLIRAFQIIAKDMPELELWLAGGIKQTGEAEELCKLIVKYGLTDKVKLLGEVNRGEIPGYLTNAKILVLPRPDSIQARGGFPTKLGEYLASGKPVIATRVGEIPKYLSKDEIFFISPDHIEKELAEKIRYIYDNYNDALVIAGKGKKKAYESFSIEANAEKVKELIVKIAR